MKKIILTIIISLGFIASILACPVCERNQPKLLKGIVHGNGPDGNWDYIIVGAVVTISLLTLYFAVKWLITPGEKDKEHIKRTILKLDDYE